MNKKFSSEISPIKTTTELIEKLTTPTPQTIKAVSQLQGGCLIIGVGGKMGPDLAVLLKKAGLSEIHGVDSFPDPAVLERLEQLGIKCMQGDLLDDLILNNLPPAPNIFLLAGYKFGTTGNEPLLWAVNAELPAKIIRRFRRANIIYLSSGNVYPFTPVNQNGSKEIDPVEPVGEYAQSRLAGERLIQYYSKKRETPVVIVRLFYATELRYGIILDIAQKIKNRQPIDLSMGYVNQIWQADAINYLAQLFPLCQTPPTIINLTGPKLSIRTIATQLSHYLKIDPILVNAEKETALLGDTSRLVKQFGPPLISPEEIIQWVVWWVQHDGFTFNKPTKYERRDGQF